MTSQVIYKGTLRTTATHLHSGSEIETDAPLDNQGLAQRFSPTDLVATALASCMATIMGIKARDAGWNIEGTLFEVEKIMVTDPRRIGAVNVQIHFPKGETYDERAKTILERAALTCPVMESLHPDCVKNIQFIWP